MEFYQKVKEERTVKIKIKDEGDYISFYVEDDGVGMTEEELQNLFKKGVGKGAGIGLYNVNERLTVAFCKECALSIESKTGEGTKVSFKIPKIYLQRNDIYEEAESINY